MKSTLALLLIIGPASAFVIPSKTFGSTKLFSAETEDAAIVSPFDDSQDFAAYKRADPVELLDGPLDLTWENVEAVLDEMRPYLIQDGGNVAIKEIDGPVVRLELQVSHPSARQISGDKYAKHILTLSPLPGSLWNMPVIDANYENGFGTKIARAHPGNSGSGSEHARGA